MFLDKFLAKRRATRDLAVAMQNNDLVKMQCAITRGADLTKVSSTFDEPGQHFQMTYGVRGALALAIEHRLPMSAFELLLDAGAQVPLTPQGAINAKALFNHQIMGEWRQAQGICDMIEKVGGQRRELNSRTPQSTISRRAPRF